MKKLSTSAVTIALLATVLVQRVSAAGSGPYIYVANAGEDTVSKIDVSSNTEVARYATWFTSGALPSYFAHASTTIIGGAPYGYGRASHAAARRPLPDAAESAWPRVGSRYRP